MNFVSLSDMIFLGIPKVQTQYLKKSSAHYSALKSDFIGINKQNLLNLSIILKILSKPLPVTGKCVMKSMVICSNGLSGFWTGCKSPIGF